LGQVGRFNATAQFACALGYSRARKAIVFACKSIRCDQSATTYKKSIRWRIYCLSVTPRSANFHNGDFASSDTITERPAGIPSPSARYL
jgi:hypothetical protein